MLTRAQREAMEWREFDHRQKLREATEYVDADTSLFKGDGPPRPDPNAGRTVRVTVPGRERVTRRHRDMVAVDGDGRAVYEETELQVPATRDALVWEADVEGRRKVEHDGRLLVVRLPRKWTPEDVMGWLQFAADVFVAAKPGDGSPVLTLSGMARLMAAHAEPRTSLINARWVPSAAEVSVAEWITATWLPWIEHAIERVAVKARLQGLSLRKIGVGLGYAAGDTNHTKAVIRKGLGRIACKLDLMGPEAWPRLAEMKFVLDDSH